MYKRQSSYFGVNALLTKPAQSIAPVAVLALWTSYGFREQKAEQQQQTDTGAHSVSETNPILASPQSTQLQHVIFVCCTLGPLLTGLLQLLVWRFYTLHGQRLVDVKRSLHKLHSRMAASGSDSSAIELGQAALLHGEEDAGAATDDERGSLHGDEQR